MWAASRWGAGNWEASWWYGPAEQESESGIIPLPILVPQIRRITTGARAEGTTLATAGARLRLLAGALAEGEAIAQAAGLARKVQRSAVAVRDERELLFEL